MIMGKKKKSFNLFKSISKVYQWYWNGLNESGFLHFSVCINVCVCEHVAHTVARLSNLKPGLKAHLSLVVDRRGPAARRSIHLYC